MISNTKKDESESKPIKVTKKEVDDRPFTTVIGGQGLSGIKVEGGVGINHGGVSYYTK